MSIKRDYRLFDFWLVLLITAAAIFGIIIIGSATRINVDPSISNEYYSQRLYFAAGFVLMLAAAFIDYHFIAKFYLVTYLLNIGLLLTALVFLPDTGNSTARNISFGFISIMPSEFAKVFMILFLAALLDKQKERMNHILILLLILISILIPVYLIIRQPSLSAGLVTFVISMIMLFAAGLDFRYYLVTGIIVVPPSILFYLDYRTEEKVLLTRVLEFLSNILSDYQMGRINSWVYPDSNSWDYYQTNQSIHAIGSGLLQGKGLYSGTLNQLNYLPASKNDFIFAVIGEEFGFVGCALVMLLLLAIILKCLLTAYQSVDLLGRLIATGVAGMLAFQTFVNIGVAMGILPNTGMALPFISSGGSSMFICMIGIGLVINVGMSKTKSFFEG